MIKYSGRKGKMENRLWRKGLIFVIIILFIGTAIIPNIARDITASEGEEELLAYRHFNNGIRNAFYTKNITISPSKFAGVCYSPFRDNEASGFYPTREELQEDISLINKLANSTRTFRMMSTLMEIPEICQGAGLDCYPGAWISKQNNSNDNEIQRLIQVANQNLSCVKRLIVGNEVLLREDLSEDELIDYIWSVKNSTSLPVSTAEVWSVWLGHPQLADNVDFILAHIHPYWDGIAVEDAAGYVVDKWDELKTLYGKEVIIGETGWPTEGDSVGEAVPTEENQRVFLSEFLQLAEGNDIEYFYFEVFDEKWKRINYEVEAHWGLYYSNGSLKPLLENLVPLEAVEGIERPPRDRRVPMPWHVYEDAYSPENHFFSSGWMGDLANWPGDPEEVFDDAYIDDPYSGENCIRIIYTPGSIGWSGIYWQFPENNWGDCHGYNISNAVKLLFWAKGDIGGEKAEFKVGGISSSGKPYQDSLFVSTGVIDLTNEWEKYEIDLIGQNLSMVIGGFCWVTNQIQNPSGCTIYLDEICFIGDTVPPEISDIQSYPDPQELDGYVNISCSVTDNIEVDTVKVNVTGPDGFPPINMTMFYSGGNSYYYNQSYMVVGQYEFYIWATDISGNSNMSFVEYFTVLTLLNEPPVVYDEYPENESMDVERPPTELRVTVDDPNNDTLDVYIKWKVICKCCINNSNCCYSYDDDWITVKNFTGVANGTYEFIPSDDVTIWLNDWIWGNTTYIWSVNVTDGTFWTNETYQYTTGGSRYDVNNNDLVNFQDAGLVWVHRTSEVCYDGIYDVNQDGQVNFQDAGLTWINRG